MRDDSYLEAESVAKEATAAAWRTRAATTAGALISVAILVAVVVWSYRLGVRDAAEIPVIRAEMEATKMRPEEPGGLEVAHQDRAVYGVVSGEAATGASGLAPEPETLAVEDRAPVERAPAPTPRPAESADVVVASPDPAPQPEIRKKPVVSVPAPEPVETPAAPETGGGVALEETAVDDGGEDAVAEAEGALDVAGVAPATAPVARPRPVRTAAAAPQETAPEPRAAALASKVQIQLGAFVSEEIAAEQWNVLKSRNGDLLAGRGRVITSVLSGGRKFYRLRAGPFEDVNEASALCRALKSRNEACIVARAD